MIRIGTLIAATLVGPLPTAGITSVDAAERLEPLGRPYEVAGGLTGKRRKDGDYKRANDVSAIACQPSASGRRRCLIVDDENPGAQFVTIEGRTVTPGPVVDLIGEAPSEATLGAPPARHDCPEGTGKDQDLDGEGVAYDAPYFYVAGSHGCSRKGRQFKASSFVLARIRVGAHDAPVGLGEVGPGDVETTYRLSDALARAEVVGPHFAQDLQTTTVSNGLNVEGVAVAGGRLYAGLRAPSLAGTAYIVVVGLDDLFAPGQARMQAKPTVIPVEVGTDSGIRDLSVLPDGRLLVLTGPAQEQDAAYALLAVDTSPGGTVETLGTLAGLGGKDAEGKAEAVTPLGHDRLLVLFDGLRDGGPREYGIGVRRR